MGTPMIWQLSSRRSISQMSRCGPLHGRGEVARYIGRHGTKRVAAAVLIGAVPPVMVNQPQSGRGSDRSIDGLRAVSLKTVLSSGRLRHHVLWRQSARRESLAGDAGSVLAWTCRAVSRMFMTASGISEDRLSRGPQENRVTLMHRQVMSDGFR